MKPTGAGQLGWLLRWSSAGIVAVVLIALLSATQQWAELSETPKAMSWFAALAFQGVSWALLVVMIPVLGLAVRRWPLDDGEGPTRAAAHALGSVAFAGVFLLAAVPIRGLVHPAPVVWEFVGVPFYKSAPQWVLVALGLYWVALIAWSYLEARTRLARVRALGADPPTPAPERVALRGRSGELVVDPSQIVWVKPNGRGSIVCIADREERVRESLADLENRLAPHGLVRVHRSCLLNGRRVREVRVPGSRDGAVVLDTGDEFPVTRRRADALRAALNLTS